jgi:hypothetical protein
MNAIDETSEDMLLDADIRANLAALNVYRDVVERLHEKMRYREEKNRRLCAKRTENLNLKLPL